MFVGRNNELQQLEEKYNSEKGELVVIYGRRRIGKSSLVEKFAENKHSFFKFEGIEGANSKDQIAAFVKIMGKYVRDPFLDKIHFDSWHTVFDYMTQKLATPTKKTKKKPKSNLFF